MITYLKNILLQKDNYKTVEEEFAAEPSESTADKVQVAAAALFVEMAKADGEFTENERNNIIKSLQDIFSLDKKSVEELIELSEKKINDSISNFEFTTIINDNFSKEEKIELIKNLWRVVYSDEKLDMYEDRLMKMLRGMLQLDHKDVIDAKLSVKEEMKKQQ